MNGYKRRFVLGVSGWCIILAGLVTCAGEPPQEMAETDAESIGTVQQAVIGSTCNGDGECTSPLICCFVGRGSGKCARCCDDSDCAFGYDCTADCTAPSDWWKKGCCFWNKDYHCSRYNTCHDTALACANACIAK